MIWACCHRSGNGRDSLLNSVRNAAHRQRSSLTGLVTLMKWYCFLVPIVKSMSHLRKALPGWTTVHANLRVPTVYCKSHRGLGKSDCMRSLHVVSLSTGSCTFTQLVSSSYLRKIITVLGLKVFSGARGTSVSSQGVMNHSSLLSQTACE